MYWDESHHSLSRRHRDWGKEPQRSKARCGGETISMDEWIGQALGGWQVRELRIARGFRECQGLSTEQLEDIYQETAVSLLRRAYLNEEHLCKSLRK